MATTKKGFVSHSQVFSSFSGYDLEGRVADVCEMLLHTERKAKEHILHTFGAECASKCEVYLSWEQREYLDDYSLVLRISRPETKDEEEQRLAKEEQDRSLSEAWERQQYEALKKKFEGK